MSLLGYTSVHSSLSRHKSFLPNNFRLEKRFERKSGQPRQRKRESESGINHYLAIFFNTCTFSLRTFSESYSFLFYHFQSALDKRQKDYGKIIDFLRVREKKEYRRGEPRPFLRKERKKELLKKKDKRAGKRRKKSRKKVSWAERKYQLARFAFPSTLSELLCSRLE